MANSVDVREGELFITKAQGIPLMLTRVEGRAYAVENRCAHLGWSMARGKIVGPAIECPWHGSRYDVRTGENLDWVNSLLGMPLPEWMRRAVALGKEPAPLRTFETTEESGQIFVTIPATSA